MRVVRLEVESGLLELEGPNIFLEVTCTNSLGSDTAQALPIGLAPDNDDDNDPAEDDD